MTQNAASPIPALIPESAPFTAEQRTWLNGFFAGLLSLDGGINALSSDETAALMKEVMGSEPATARGPLDDGDDGAAPWHDPAMPLGERMELAEKRPLRRRMMAAMGQQDCGQCGYTCEDYANAIARKTEERLNLCVPGGKETTRTLKVLYAEFGAIPATAKAPAAGVPTPSADAAPATAVPTRDSPAEATFISRTKLNKPGSQKETWHIDIDLAQSGIDYTVGDAFGVLPLNDPALVDAVIAALHAPADFPIAGRPLREVLTDSVSLGLAPDMLFQLISYITGGERRQKAQTLGSGGDPDGDAATLDVLATLEKFSGIRPDPEAFIEALDPLQPRLFSIASSPKAAPGKVSLTVDAVRYKIGKRGRVGVASTWFADRIAPGTKIKAYVQKAFHFGLPADPSTPIIMIGPGTGIAPFRAFLHERMATKAPGRNWLFFGHQRRDYDFFYQDELAGMRSAGVLTRLSLAWSRDDQQKFYVQDRMREVGRDLWAWLAEGAHVYVCGHVTMSKDVERAMVDVIAAHGARSIDQAVAFLGDLKKNHRYHTDVY